LKGESTTRGATSVFVEGTEKKKKKKESKSTKPEMEKMRKGAPDYNGMRTERQT
jgi:hypothetical protein